MAHQLRFLAQPLPNVPSDELLRRYRHIDELGFDLAVVADHLTGTTRQTLGLRHGPFWRRSPGKPQASGWRPG